MTHLLIWLLAYPLVAGIDTIARIYMSTRDRSYTCDVGKHNRGKLIVYILGTALLVVVHYV